MRKAAPCAKKSWTVLPLASALLACMHPAHAADTADAPVLEEITVTAQKRSENLQDVPLSIQAFSTARARRAGYR
jgi:outer membrane receptor protein involved in Fe transport